MSILKESRNQSLDRITKQVLAVVSEQFFCLRIDEDDFPSFIDDDHRVWRGLKQLTEGEGFGLHSNLRVPRHGARTSPFEWARPRRGWLPRRLQRYCFIHCCGHRLR